MKNGNLHLTLDDRLEKLEQFLELYRISFHFLISFPAKPVALTQRNKRTFQLRAVQYVIFRGDRLQRSRESRANQRHHPSSPFRHYRSVFVLTSPAYVLPNAS